jgi:hypothetical protein
VTKKIYADGRSAVNRLIDIEAEATWEVCLAHAWGGTTVFFNRAESKNITPIPICLPPSTMATVEQYREWIEVRGTALCSERTKRGRLCSLPIASGGIMTSPDEWLAKHRSEPCKIHGGRQP